MPVLPNFEKDLDIFFQCRIPGCNARCRVSPKFSGRLGDHWKKVHIEDHGLFNGREVLVKMRNADGTFSTTTFEAYANANGITYKTQDNPRPNRHEKAGSNSAAKPKATVFSAPAKIRTVRGPMHPTTTPLAPSTSLTTASATALLHPTSNLRRVARMERQLRIASASMASRRTQEEEDPDPEHYPDTQDSHPSQPLPGCRSKTNTSTTQRQPLKRNLSQAFREAKASPTTAESGVKASGSSAPPKIPFSQMLIEHLLPQSPPKAKTVPSPAPTIRTAASSTEALRGFSSLPSHIKPSSISNNTAASSKKDYSHSTWCCEMCHIEFPSMNAVTIHLRDHHAVEADVVTLTPDRDVITMVLASVRSGDKAHGWVDGNGETVREGKKMRGKRKRAGKGDVRDREANREKRHWKLDAEEARMEIESEMGENMEIQMQAD